MNRLEKLEQENAGLREYADSRDESIKVYRQELEAEREKVRELKEALEKIEDYSCVVMCFCGRKTELFCDCAIIASEALGHLKENKCE